MEANTLVAGSQGQQLQHTTINGGLPHSGPVNSSPSGVVDDDSFPTDLAKVGIPADGHYEIHSAFDTRACPHHGDEYLLGARNRWMRACDLDVLEADLEKKLQEHKDNPSTFDPSSQLCQAECRGTLYSQVHAVLAEITHGNHNYYLIQWKACWTRRFLVDDEKWIPSSLKKHQSQRCRRSGRLAESLLQRMRSREGMWWYLGLDGK
jgi:hypothetical protein